MLPFATAMFGAQAAPPNRLDVDVGDSTGNTGTNGIFYTPTANFTSSDSLVAPSTCNWTLGKLSGSSKLSGTKVNNGSSTPGSNTGASLTFSVSGLAIGETVSAVFRLSVAKSGYLSDFADFTVEHTRTV